MARHRFTGDGALMLQHIGGGRVIDHGPGSAIAGGTLGGSQIVPHLAATSKKGHVFVPRKPTRRALEAAAECNRLGGPTEAAKALGVTRSAVGNLVRRA